MTDAVTVVTICIAIAGLVLTSVKLGFDIGRNQKGEKNDRSKP